MCIRDRFWTSSSMSSELEALFSPQHCSTSGLGQPVQPKQTHPYEGQLAESRLQLQNMHTQVQALRAEASAERATAQRTAAENEGLRCESAQLQGQLKLIRSEMFKLRRLLGEKDADLAAVKKVNAELKRSTVGAECTAGLLELQSNMRDQARKLAIVRARADQKEASLEQQTSELVQLRHELDLKCAELEVGMQRTKAAEAQCSEARAELERLQDARELDQQRVLETAEVEHRNSQLQCKIDELESQLFKHTIEAAPTAASTAVPSCAKRLSRKEMRESEMSRVMGEMQLASPTHADAAQDMDDGLSRDLVRVRSESMQAASVEAMGPSQDADPQSLIPEDRFLV
eukprot:TRINITY_DN20026_c0_g1_i2.p1 TRINITY_DN20026_c0_g1~~TRINITY_DN20026_c0_g1_i2.p1  ORF type:complete len:346 (+),score=108.64 TRINITY_DN20026_c0_g1_i2:76-1113(+)